MGRLAESGYFKMIAIDVSDLESKIVDERHTNFLCDVENFYKKYSNEPEIRCVYIHIDDNCDVKYQDYKKIHKNIHPLDYMRDVSKKYNGRYIIGSDYLHIVHRNEYLKLEEICFDNKLY